MCGGSVVGWCVCVSHGGEGSSVFGWMGLFVLYYN